MKGEWEKIWYNGLWSKKIKNLNIFKVYKSSQKW
jgi:hypothetical protein